MLVGEFDLIDILVPLQQMAVAAVLQVRRPGGQIARRRMESTSTPSANRIAYSTATRATIPSVFADPQRLTGGPPSPTNRISADCDGTISGTPASCSIRCPNRRSTRVPYMPTFPNHPPHQLTHEFALHQERARKHLFTAPTISVPSKPSPIV